MIIKFNGYSLTVDSPEIQEQIKNILFGGPKTSTKPRANKSWSPAELEHLRELVSQGLDIDTMATQLGRTASAVYNKRFEITHPETKMTPLEDIPE